jgi:hypothetical protein
MAKPYNFPEKQQSFRNLGALDIKELSLFVLPHFSLLLDARRRTYFVSLCYNRVVVGHSDLAVCHVRNNDIWTGHSEDLPPGSAVSAHCETPAPSVTLTNICFTNRGTALSIQNPLSLTAIIVAYNLKKIIHLALK